MYRVLFLFAAAAALSPAEVTYSKEIARIIQNRCESCHRAGDIAPFTLSNFRQVVFRSRAIERALVDHSMPPWKPVEGFGEFTASIQMPEDERKTFLDWIRADMPEGDPRDLPLATQDKGDWPMGAPDQTLSMLQTYKPVAGQDTYRCFIIPAGNNEIKYLSAVDVLPGARSIVHHVLLFQDNTGAVDKLDYADGQPGYTCFGGPGLDFGGNTLNMLNAGVAGWAPGQRTQLLPAGVGIPLQKGAKLIIQVHYHPRDGEDVDQTRVGLYFSKVPVTQRLYFIPVVNTKFTIPPYATNYVVSADLPVVPLIEGKVIWVYPHMHLLGRQIKVDVLKADRTIDPIIYEDKWEFNWQGAYTLKNPLAVKGGSTVRLTCTYDNTGVSNGHHGPALGTPQPVSWGESTTDEMCLAFLGVTLDNEAILRLLLPAL